MNTTGGTEMKTFTQEDAVKAADTFKKNAIDEIKALIHMLNDTLLHWEETKRCNIKGNVDLRMSQMMKEAANAEVMSRLAEHLSD